MMTNLSRTSILAVAVLATAAGAWGQFRHPRYLHARTDLRRAVILMQVPEEPNVARDMRVAADQVERAIHELDLAARFDRRDIDEHPPVDIHLGRGSRFREILRLLGGARRDIAQEEDNPLAREWRNRAFGYIDAAMGTIQKAGYDKFRDETVGMAAPPPPAVAPPPPGAVHPRYASAISDLRYARALLFRPDWRDIMRDQRAAVEEIDRAIGAAKAAAIDDGKNPDAHPPIDARMGWEGRFRKAMELLDSAQRNLSFEEDNRAAGAWRAAALRNVENAKAFVARAMRDSWWR